MSRIEIIQFKYLSDNYGVLLHDKHTKKTVAIDAGDVELVLNQEFGCLWILSEARMESA